MISIDVVICAYTELRWSEMVRAVDSVQVQTTPAEKILLVIDHNEDLLQRASSEFEGQLVSVIANQEDRGLSGARNTGLAASTAEAVAFLDDDAWAAPDWLEEFGKLLSQESVVGVGGRVEADWELGRPGWFPREFDWIVGCSYIGLPTVASPIRNPIGASMAFRSDALHAVGGFDSRLGRVGTRPVGCEETEMSIRARQRYGSESVMYAPASVVHHSVTADRSKVSYFLRRGWSEGLSKASVASRVGSDEALESERTYVSKTLPRGFVRNLAQPAAGWTRAVMMTAGLLATAMGYAVGLAKRNKNVSGVTS